MGNKMHGCFPSKTFPSLLVGFLSHLRYTERDWKIGLWSCAKTSLNENNANPGRKNFK